MCKKCAKIANFGFYGLNYGKTVNDRWVHAAMRLTSIEFSFDPCNIYRDGPRGVGYPADARSVGDSHPSCSLKSQ